jgi:hypothetical protein
VALFSVALVSQINRHSLSSSSMVETEKSVRSSLIGSSGRWRPVARSRRSRDENLVSVNDDRHEVFVA